MAVIPKIELSSITKSFDANHVLKEINLTVAPQESLVIIGTSGCGKSVLMKCLNGLITPDQGSIKIDGQEILGQGRAALEGLRQRFGMTFQFGALFDSLPIWENVTFRLRHQQALDKKDARDIAAQTITQLGLAASVIDQYPAELSGGMQKRVALARAIVDKPEILLFDEPTSALDVSVQSQILNLLNDLRDELNLTYIIISHNLAVVEHIAPRVAVMYLGRIVEIADTDTLFKDPQHPYTRALLD